MPNPYEAAGSVSTTLSSARATSGSQNKVSKGTLMGTQPASHDYLVDKTYTAWQIICRLLSLTKGHNLLFILAFGMSAISTILQMYLPILIGAALDCLVGPGQIDTQKLATIVQEALIFVVFSALLLWVSTYITSRLSYQIVENLRQAAHTKLDSLPLAFFDTHPHGDTLARIAYDTDQVGDGLLQGLGSLFSGIVTIGATLYFMFSLNIWIALVVVILTPLSIIVSWFIAKRSSSAFAHQQNLMGALSGLINETLAGQTLINVFHQQSAYEQKLKSINNEVYLQGEKAQFISSLSNPTTRLVNNIIYAATALVGAVFIVINNQANAATLSTDTFLLTAAQGVSVGMLQSFLVYANQYMKPFNEISSVVTQVQASFASASRVFSLLDAESEVLNKPNAQPLVNIQGKLNFEHVNFAYEPKHPVINDFSLEVLPKHRYALVGPTGCGKTTLINLLLRFYEPQSGTILLDNKPISSYTVKSLRHTFGMVLQDSWTFVGTVYDNIAYGKDNATKEEVVAAAKAACAHEFITQLPQGYDTLLGTGSFELSSGQKQLICIARTMLANAPLLLLDEATSRIDTRTELLVQEAFDRMMEGRTSLVVAHRLSTIIGADCIVVINEGHIVEMGTHNELLAKRGAYYNLYMSQFVGSNLQVQEG